MNKNWIWHKKTLKEAANAGFCYIKSTSSLRILSASVCHFCNR